LSNQNPLRFKKTIQSESKEITLNIDHDQLSVFMSIIPKTKGRLFEVRQIYEMLDNEGVLNGVKRGVIADLIAKINDTSAPIREEVIARGTPITPGKDAEIKYHFKVNEKIRLVANDAGKINHRELNLINNVEKDQLLAEKIPGVPPVAGTDIYGESILPDGIKDAKIIAGKNVEIKNDGMKAYSQIDGQAFLKNRMIQVSPIFTVPHDVDLNVGNITFNGTIIVLGNVLSGFTLKAKEDIHIKGIVEGAHLVAGGNITISGGLKGQGKATIQCRGDINVSFAERANLECHGNLRIQSSMVNTDVTCYSRLEALSGKGSLVGGDIKAIGGIECLEAGSKLGVSTKLTVGDKFIVRERLSSVVENQNLIKESLKKLNQKILENKAVFEQIDSLPPDRKAPLQEVLDQVIDCKTQLEELDSKHEKLSVLLKMKCDSIIRIKKHTHPNVFITIGHSILDVKSQYANSTFSENHTLNAVKVSSA
tara:strand:+ start:3704 stop:5143 length:1440 start_codon:yes stop_codon:yes gene_type:complete